MLDTADIRSFEIFFTTYKQRFVSFANSYLRDEAMANDLVMDAFIYYWENRELLENEDNIPAYVLKIIKNKCLNYLRNQSIHQDIENQLRTHQQRLLEIDILSLEACDPQELFSEEVELIVKETLEQLPELTRIIFTKSRFEQKTYKEIADELHLTEKKVEFHISKALKLFRITLKDYLPEVLIFLFIAH